MAIEVKIIEITFDAEKFRGGNIAKVEQTLAQMLTDGWRIIASGGAGMGYGYHNPDYNRFNDEEKGIYDYHLLGFVVLQREYTPPPSPPKPTTSTTPNEVIEISRKLKDVPNRPKSNNKLVNYINALHGTRTWSAEEIITFWQKNGLISIDKNGQVQYIKFYV